MILENSVYKYVDSEDGERIRIIFVNDEEGFAYYVSMETYISTPKEVSMEKLNSELKNDILIQIPDPFLKNINEEFLTDLQREKRDFEWAIVEQLWFENVDVLLNKKSRNKEIRKISEEHGISLSTVKKIFSRFWQRGMTKNSLLPDYINSGGRGKSRRLGNSKVGRPKKVNYKGESTKGINITDDIRTIFELSIDKYYNKKQKPSLKSAYNSMLREFFSDKIVEKGEIKHKVWDESRIPTYDQFYYWHKKLRDVKKEITFRESGKAFELKGRATLGDSKQETDGPGTRFQIDATIADVYLVSSLSRNRIIGRPVVYAVMDVYSRLITGIYAGLEGPSWIGAAMALDNMVCDKAEFCEKFGIQITNEQWPSSHLPEIIIADRGEFEGYSVENLINNLNIKIENTPPYRGDLKGIVERKFRTVNEKIKHKTPGAILKEFRERGDRDYRLDATLTLEEFTKIFIKMVLHHNHKIVEGYQMDKEMIADEIAPTPVNLWNWGIGNKKGRLRVIERDIMRLNLLPRGKASISRAGFRFKKLYYSSQKAIEEQWFIKPKNKRVEVIYDPRNMNQIYIPHEDGRNYEICYLLEKSIQYRDCILEEIIFQEELREELVSWESQSQNQLHIDLDKDIEQIVKNAKKEKKSSEVKESKSKKIKGIKDNRKIEKIVNRNEEAFVLGEEEKKEGIVKSFERNAEDKKETRDSRKEDLMKKIRKKRDESLGKKQ